MQNIIICEDIPAQAKHLQQEVEKLNIPELSCKVYSSAAELLKDLPEMNAYSIFLLDVMMPDIDGISLAKIINESHPHSCIIYITAYIHTVTDAQDTKHCYFLLKSELEKRLPIAVEKAMNLIKETAKTILVTQGSSKLVVNTDDILYLERVKRYTYIVTKNEKLRVKEDIKDLMSVLGPYFHRCHNSFVVNFSKVTAINKQTFFIDSWAIPISRSHSKTSEAAFHDYMIHTI